MACGGCASREAKAERDIREMQKENNAKTLLERGRAYAFMGDQTRAEDYLAAALEAGADPRVALPMLMDVCVRAGRYRSAIQHGEDFLRHHPADGQTRLMVGALYTALDEHERAKAQLQMVLDHPAPPPETLHGEAHYYLGVVARDEHDPVAADLHFREYLRIEPHGAHVEEAKDSLMKQMPPAANAAPPIQTIPMQTTPTTDNPPKAEQAKTEGATP